MNTEEKATEIIEENTTQTPSETPSETPKNTESKSPKDYAYRPEAQVVISGDLFMALQYGLSKLMKNETKTVFKTTFKTEEEFFGQDGEVHISEDGMLLNSLLRSLTIAHTENVKAGRATTIEDLKKPQIELVR